MALLPWLLLPLVYFRRNRVNILPRLAQDRGEVEIRSEEKYKALIEQASDAILISDADGLILETNCTSWKLFKFPKEELESMNISQLYLAKELRERPFQYRELFEKKVVRSQRTVVCKDGSHVPVEATVKRLSDGRFMAILRDNSERIRTEGELKAAIEKYEFVARATSDTIWDWDINRNIKTYNGGIRTVFGYDVQEVGNAYQWIIDKIHPEDLQRVRDAFLRVIDKKTETLQLEYRFRCADGTYKHVFDRSFVIYGTDHNPARVIGTMQDITKTRMDEKRIEKAVLDAQEKERLHLGRELHDNVNQILASGNMTLKASIEYLPDISKVTELIEAGTRSIDLAMEEIRKLSHELAPAGIEDSSLKDIVSELLHRVNIQEKYVIEFEFDESLYCLMDEGIIINIYRILQEQLKNITKYAEAKHITIVLGARDRMIYLKISDDGRGFDPRTVVRGIGLNNIKKRIDSLSGKFILKSAPGMGCTIIAEFSSHGKRTV